jgi:hypothetical protein
MPPKGNCAGSHARPFNILLAPCYCLGPFEYSPSKRGDAGAPGGVSEGQFLRFSFAGSLPPHAVKKKPAGNLSEWGPIVTECASQ